MKILRYSVLGLLVIALSTAQAAKPDSAGKGKPEIKMSEKRAEKAMTAKSEAKNKAEAAQSKAKGKSSDVLDEAEDKVDEAKKKGKMADQKADASDKSDAVLKEAGKGSETGQAKREENSRKWWKFWGD
ncbi:hypothetical protein DDZ13_03700 [Coraliomargarita sinensis]|uniref:Uncharacterized protein n=1 Tax=Coraliomargarita sinensis TaxID=2174842 RepID=A0A317ZHX1_9BACT|nr:hypothetical protein [Coraliomargarita sinensis]PXA05080.1 hypothetical protein DDZ13_03700 [Coraliomargarita sinensis]